MNRRTDRGRRLAIVTVVALTFLLLAVLVAQTGFRGLAASVVGAVVVAALSAVAAIVGYYFARREFQQVSRTVVSREVIAQLAEPFARARGELVRDLLDQVVMTLAEEQEIKPRRLRASIFGPVVEGGPLTLIDDLVDRRSEKEEGHRPLIVEESSSQAYRSGHPHIAIRSEAGLERELQGQQPVESEEDLWLVPRWVVSVPILGEPAKPVLVLTVEGFRRTRLPDELKDSIPQLLYSCAVMSILLREFVRSQRETTRG